MSRGLPVFERFIDDLRAVWSAEPDNGRRMEMAKRLLEALVRRRASIRFHFDWNPLKPQVPH
jgi:hypothetical protein